MSLIQLKSINNKKGETHRKNCKKKVEKNNVYVEVLTKIASLMGRTKESIQMSSSNTHTSITMFAENNSKIIGNWYFDASDSKELVDATFNGLKALVESLEHNKSNDGQAA